VESLFLLLSLAAVIYWRDFICIIGI